MKNASGHYLNIYDEQGYDIFVIFNEPNDAPTADELSAIGNIVEQAIDSGIPEEDACGSFRNKLANLIEATNLPCVKYGVQVIFSF